MAKIRPLEIGRKSPAGPCFHFRSLDLSFNRLTKIENLGSLTRLRKLFLIHNKITKIENIDHLVDLEMLELGSNRIRVGYITYFVVKSWHNRN